jgi:membrane protease YdiL (CAAX protease family)
VTSVKFCLWLIPAVGFAKWVRRENPYSYLGLGALPDRKAWAGAFLAIGLFGALVAAFELLVGGKMISLDNLSSTGWAAGISFYLVSPWVEEVLFRGLVLHELSAFLKFPIANLVTSGLFVGIHLPYWIHNGNHTAVIAAQSIGIGFFSLFAGWLYIRSKSIWPATAAHVANNILSAMIKGS